MGVRLDRLLDGVDVRQVVGDPSTTVVGDVVHDTRAVSPGSLFCCLPGKHIDGHDLAGTAVTAGAAALLAERTLPVEATQVIVNDSRAAMGPVAARFHGDPSRHLQVVGVTGTNGKTTTTHLLNAVFEAAGVPAEVIGTLSARSSSSPGTTPEAPELQATLARLVRRSVRAVALEVSSHALDQHRVDGMWFSAAVFTNLSPEHLDYHPTMDDYFEVKARLFDPARAAVGVVNADDPYGQRLLERARLPVRTFSLADAEDLDFGPQGTTFRWRGQALHLGQPGPAAVANALAAATTAVELGVDAAVAAEALSSAPVVPGRFEPVDRGQPFLVVVDYAHTPAALATVLGTARLAAGDGRVLLVFGCGGDRDRAKRPLMGEVAARLADMAVLTSDNPRHEDPLAIIAEVRSGVDDADRLVVEPDRRAAIAKALAGAARGDVVVIAGKGHETLQVTGDTAEPFDDRVVAGEELARLRQAS